MANKEAQTQHTDSWHSDKWEMLLRSYRRLYSKFEPTDLIEDKDNPEIEIEDTAINNNDVSETIIDVEADREIKRGYSPDLGYYYNFIAVDMFREQNKTFIFDYKDMANAITFGVNPIQEGVRTLNTEDVVYLDKQLRFSPEAAINGLREAVYRIMKEAHHDYAMEIKDEFKARFKNLPTKIALSDITNKHIGHIYSFEGFVTAVDEETRLLYLTTKWVCGNGHITEVDGRNRPPQCRYCDKRFLDAVPGGITETYQEFRLQQRHDQTRDGRIAVERDVVMIGDDIVNIVQGGDYVELTGIVKVREDGNRRKTSDIADFYIESSYIERKADEAIMVFSERDSFLLEDEVKEAVHLETEDLDYEKLKRSVAPSVVGHEIVKEAIILQMASSDSRTFSDGTPHRGHICLLFCGSPATAKTVIANYARKTHIRSVMPTGEGLSKAGLTASVDTKTSPPRLWAGAYLMAKNGLVVVDEMQALKQDILDALLEACEDAQTITITKAGIHRPLKADCASLHLCNPKLTSYWDDTKNLMENTGLKANLLSRYDAVIIFRDVPDIEDDKKKADWWMQNFVNAPKDYLKQTGQQQKEDRRTRMRRVAKSGLYSLPFMAMWLRYVRKTFHPALDPKSDAFKIIQNFYLNFRKTDARFFAQGGMSEDDDGTRQKIPSITMRQLAALIRWAEASARAHHRNEVKAKDAEIACQIMKFSIMNSGFNPITKNAIAIETESGNATNPKISEIDIMRLAEITKDKFYKESARKFKKFEHVLKRKAINRCIYCKGSGEEIEYGKQQNCSQCQGFGCVNIEFMLSDIEDALSPAGFTRADVEYIATVFEKRNIISKSKYNIYKATQRYSFKKGWPGISMFDTDVEIAMDLDENKKKLEMLSAGMSEEDRRKLFAKVGQELSKS